MWKCITERDCFKIKVLIIGSGVLESNLAHSIKKGNDVTILARNKTYEDLKSNGFIIKYKLGKKNYRSFQRNREVR